MYVCIYLSIVAVSINWIQFQMCLFVRGLRLHIFCIRSVFFIILLNLSIDQENIILDACVRVYICGLRLYIFSIRSVFFFIWMHLSLFLSIYISIYIFWRCPWCSRYRRGKWTRRHEFKSWTWLIAFHIALIPLGKVWIQLFSLQLWANSRAD